MTHDRAIELLKIERECINRNNQPFGKNCDRNCSKCDLVQNPEKLLKMYDYVIDVMEKELKQLKEQEGMKDGKYTNSFTCIDCVRYGDLHSSCTLARDMKLNEDSPICDSFKRKEGSK